MNLLDNAPAPVARHGDRILARSRATSPYRLRLAENRADIRAAQNLRFIVFNVELNEGLEESYATCLDADAFDDVCDHLLVEDVRTGEVVGTYRLQTGNKAGSALGYYSAQEFDFAPFETERGQMIELGRACVLSQHRNLAVLGLLWKGIADYARQHGGRYLIGCSSLTSQSAPVGAALFQQFQARYLAPANWMTRPLAAVACPLDDIQPAEPVKTPKLLAAYLSLGAKICAPPAIDRAFKTIDFLTLLDLESLPPATVQRYLN